jgi:hypothetical protein
MSRAFGSAFTVTGLVLLSCLPLAAQEPTTVHRAGGFDISVVGDLKGFALGFDVRTLEEGLDLVVLKLSAPTAAPPPRFTLKWSLPSQDVAGQWATGRHLNKTLRPDWAGTRLQASMFAREAPVSCLYGSDDHNVLTFAVSDALDTVLVGSGIREEDGRIYNEVTLFSEPHPRVATWSAELRLDRRQVPYWTALRGVSDWWAAQPGYTPAPVPEPARLPVYSTWYNYHQSVDATVLLKEVAIAKEMGFESIIVDDGWQTLDTGRGYAFTGDWEPERIPDMKGFVDGCHALGVKVILWYAVPFVGKNAKVAARFKDKSLRYEDRLGAYVVDPRYPEVREYLASVYRRAIRDWGIDGFKLDFIERLAADEATVLDATGGRDFASVNEAADRMMTDVLTELRKVKPDVMIEFRQPYIGPLIRKYGNMFRASDCPNSYLANRVKTGGPAAAHRRHRRPRGHDHVALRRAGGAGGVPDPERDVLGAPGLGPPPGDPQGPFRDGAFLHGLLATQSRGAARRRLRGALAERELSDGEGEPRRQADRRPVRGRGGGAGRKRRGRDRRPQREELEAGRARRRARPRPVPLHRPRQPGADGRIEGPLSRRRCARVRRAGVGSPQPQARWRATETPGEPGGVQGKFLGGEMTVLKSRTISSSSVHCSRSPLPLPKSPQGGLDRSL